MRCSFPAVALLIAAVAVAPAVADVTHLMRYADVHGERLVFTYEDDLWTASTSGGNAARITSHPGAEVWAKFSPDGERLAFTAEYDGGRDVYVMDARGGVPERLTWHPAEDRVLGWTPDGGAVLFRSRREYPFRAEQVYRVSTSGGMPERLPVDRAGLAALSPDGTRIVYNRISREDRPWKRYRGGMAQDLWLGTLGTSDFRRITEWEGSDHFPMWEGDAVYFTSDRRHGTLNLYRYDPADGEITALTDYRDYDVKYPSAGTGTIVYQYRERLHLLDLATGTSRPIDVRIPSDRVAVRSEWVPAAEHTGSFRLSPGGDRLLLEARGEIVVVPLDDEDEPARNLTNSPGTREKSASWSPDGETIAFLSDRTGEEEIYLVDADANGGGEWTQRTSGGRGYRLPPAWSPDSRWMVYSDKFMQLVLVDARSGDSKVIDRTEWDDGWYDWGIRDYTWSPDSRWVAYAKLERSLYPSIFVYSVDDGVVHRVTGENTRDWSPSFSTDGRWLFFLSNRTFEPIMGQVDQNHVYLDMTRPHLAILRRDAPSPFHPDFDPGEAGKPDEAEKPARTVVDPEGLPERILPVEGVPAGNYFRLEATDGGFLFLARTEPTFLKYQQVTDATTDPLELRAYDLAERETATRMKGIYNYHLSPDGAKLVYRYADGFGAVEASGSAEPGDGRADLSRVRLRTDPAAEFRQIFDEAWRVQRDWFYDPGLHGVDWEAIRDKYARFLPDCGNRADVNYLIKEMISELNAGHTYVGGGDLGGGAPHVPVGLLGADFERSEKSRFLRIAHIVPAGPWLPEERSPLREPGCGIGEGDYLLAIDGAEVTAADRVLSFLEGKVDRWVTVTYGSDPEGDAPRTCRVRPLGSEQAIRYREWVESNRRKVDRMSGGELAYLHVPDMMESGLVEFARVYYPQFYKKGLVIDDRYNSGGFVGDMIVDRLERRRWSMTKPREGSPIPNPERAWNGPFVVLINEETGSNGEYFAEAIRQKGLAKVIGRRTWGGAVGIEPHQLLVDGGVTTPPQFAPFGLDGGWLIEGRGVEPDVDVRNDPADVLAGRDPQLETGVRMLLETLESDPREISPVPEFPDKSKPGETRP